MRITVLLSIAGLGLQIQKQLRICRDYSSSVDCDFVNIGRSKAMAFKVIYSWLSFISLPCLLVHCWLAIRGDEEWRGALHFHLLSAWNVDFMEGLL